MSLGNKMSRWGTRCLGFFSGPVASMTQLVISGRRWRFVSIFSLDEIQSVKLYCENCTN